MAKIVYFTRSSEPPSSPSFRNLNRDQDAGSASSSDEEPLGVNGGNKSKVNGALTPLMLDNHTDSLHLGTSFGNDLLRRARVRHFPGGSLNFTRYETDDIDGCIQFLKGLIESSATLNGVSLESMRQSVRIVATGGGAHKYYDILKEELGVDVHREDEMECLITGLGFITMIPLETYWFSDELVQEIASGRRASVSEQLQLPQQPTLERPSPNPPSFKVSFEESPSTQLPCLLVNIGSGVSIIKVDADGSFERVSGTSLGGGTLWGILSLLTNATSFDGRAFLPPI